jgi:hypothetical protein
MPRTLLMLTISALLGTSCLATPGDPKDSHVAQISAGDISGNTYHNADLGLRYEFPAGWNVSPEATTPEHQYGWKDDPTGKSTANPCSRRLVFVTKHHEGMTTLIGLDPMAVVVAVDPACLPNATFPQSPNDQKATRRVADQVLDHIQTPRLAWKSASKVHPFEYAGRVIIELSQSFTIAIREPGGGGLQRVISSVAVAPVGKYWVVWIFVAANDADLGVLKGSRIFFDAEKSRPGDAK